jgi:hypothetical protein
MNRRILHIPMEWTNEWMNEWMSEYFEHLETNNWTFHSPFYNISLI